MSQEHAKHNHEEVSEESTEEQVRSVGAEALKDTSTTENLDADVDAMLDEIDDVLESNAQEFVSAFIQKGGQ